MSTNPTNPYAAPKAQVADETIVLRGNFIAGGLSAVRPGDNGGAFTVRPKRT